LNQTTPQRLALAVGVVQLFLALTWTVYVVYLPKLALASGIAPIYVPWILVLDQLVFALCDWAAGIWADRAGAVMGRIGRLVMATTALSCIAFLALPFVAPKADPPVLLALIVLWSATSSAVRAPPIVLLARYAPKPSHPLLAALLLLLGFGVAGAASPYLAALLREVDPRIPFVLASLSLFAVTWTLADAEANVPRAGPPPEPARAAHGSLLVWFLLAIVLLGAAFQLHTALNSGPAYLRFAPEDMLERLLPLFWIGFSIGIVPASTLTKAWGGPLAMAAGAVIAAAAAFVVAAATSLNTVIVAQLIAGAAWGLVLASALSAALSFGHVGAEGKFAGGLFSMLALVTLGRIASVATGTAKAPDISPLLPWAPTVGWLLAAMVLLCMLAYGKARGA
jgi:MFS family permease